MSEKTMMKKCPYKEGSNSRKIFAALARAGKKGLTASEASRFSHVPADKTRTLLAAYRNSFHCSSLTRAGLQLALEDGRYRIELCKADQIAHRPPPKKDE